MSAASLLRRRGLPDSGRVGMIELFFDLVFVFAVTQLSHALLARLTPAGAAQGALLLLAVWWVWIYTSWVTNWLDPERIPVRVALFALMLGGLVLAAALPQAFGPRGLVFAVTYVAMQVGRTVFFLWALRGGTAHLRRNFQRVLVWLSTSGLLWIGGGLAEGEARFVWWTLALLIEFAGPWALFWVPGLGRSSLADWDVDGSHMAERCGLFIIIALGESLLVTGATFAELVWTADVVAAFLSALVGSIAMWWIYFDSGAERAHHRIKHSRDPGREARMAYTYCHVLIVAGVIVGAVADEIALAHTAHASDAGVAAILGGPALYLLGVGLFKWVSNERPTPPFSHLLGLALLLALAPFGFGHAFSALALAAATSAVLVFVAVWESVVLRRPAAPRA